MTGSYKRSLFGVLTLCAGLVAGCERVDDISNVEPPRFALESGGYQLLGDGGGSTETTTATVSVEVKSSEAATLSYGKYSLFIPKNSVKKPTRFYMTVKTGSVNTVDLHAYENSGKEVSQFANGLRMTMPYDYTNVEDPSTLKLAYVIPNGDGTYQIVELANGTPDTANQTFSGTIYHFSEWTLAKELIVIID